MGEPKIARTVAEAQVGDLIWVDTDKWRKSEWALWPVQKVGRTYLERGQPVVVLKRWGKGGGPRNVLIQRADGSRVVRPFRGLRKTEEANDAP